MNLKRLFAILLSIALSAFVLSSCTEEDDNPIVNNDTPEPPQNLMAVSIDDETVKIKWEASSSESDAQFAGYDLTVVGTSFAPQSISAGETTYTITGLTEGVEYTFSLRAMFDNGNYSNPAELTWSPASRYTESLGETIKLYGSSSSVGSGLDIFETTENGPITRTVSSSNKWNFAFDDRNGYSFGTAGAGVIEYNWSNGNPEHPGEIGDDEFNYADLSESYVQYALNDDEVNYLNGSVDLTSDQFTNYDGIIIFARVQENANGEYNYARILIKRDANGFVQSDALGDYIELEISYQNESGVPYAGIKQ